MINFCVIVRHNWQRRLEIAVEGLQGEGWVAAKRHTLAFVEDGDGITSRERNQDKGLDSQRAFTQPWSTMTYECGGCG